jgi:hypothetical protein
MTATRIVDAMLRELNPVPSAATEPAPLDQRARADLSLILATAPGGHLSPASHPGQPPVPSRRVLLGSAAVIALGGAAVGALSVLDRQSGTAYAATPEPLAFGRPAEPTDPGAVLAGIAARTAGLPDDTGTGRYAHVETRSWDLFTRIDGQRVTSAVVPQHRDQWLAADGSGRLVVTATLPDGRREHADTLAAAGGLALMWPLRSLSSEVATLTRQLQAGHPVSNGPAERFAAIRDAYLQMPLPPRVRAAVLHYLAATPGLTVTGPVTDRGGRNGIGFSVESAYSGLPTRYTLIIDPRDGRLLDDEQMLTTSAGKLNVTVPAVIGYTVLLSAAYTDTDR